MLCLNEAKLNKVYKIEKLKVEEKIKKHLGNLGFIPGVEVALISKTGKDALILLHNMRIAMDQSILEQIYIVEKIQGDNEDWLSLDQVEIGEYVNVVGIHGTGAVKRRLMDMGLTKGVTILVRKRAPLGDPIELNLRGYELTLRKNEAELVLVRKEGMK